MQIMIIVDSPRVTVCVLTKGLSPTQVWFHLLNQQDKVFYITQHWLHNFNKKNTKKMIVHVIKNALLSLLLRLTQDESCATNGERRGNFFLEQKCEICIEFTWPFNTGSFYIVPQFESHHCDCLSE